MFCQKSLRVSILILQCSRDVTFVGYSIPHPSEPVMHLRVQTKGLLFL